MITAFFLLTLHLFSFVSPLCKRALNAAVIYAIYIRSNVPLLESMSGSKLELGYMWCGNYGTGTRLSARMTDVQLSHLRGNVRTYGLNGIAKHFRESLLSLITCFSAYHTNCC